MVSSHVVSGFVCLSFSLFIALLLKIAIIITHICAARDALERNGTDTSHGDDIPKTFAQRAMAFMTSSFRWGNSNSHESNHSSLHRSHVIDIEQPASSVHGSPRSGSSAASDLATIPVIAEDSGNGRTELNSGNQRRVGNELSAQMSGEISSDTNDRGMLRFFRSASISSGQSSSSIPTNRENEMRVLQNGDRKESSSSEIVGDHPEIVSQPASATRPSASNAPVCLICLETLTQEDFTSGRAISLECECRGDLALRHKDCALKWAAVKDSGRGGVPTCELCKAPVRNLPPLPPRPHLIPDGQGEEMSEDMMSSIDPSAFANFAPSTADLMFDCVRVCWVAMIVSILFFEASLASALWTGVVAGLAYALLIRVLYRQHFRAMQAYAEAAAAIRQHVAEASELQNRSSRTAVVVV